MGSGSSFLHLLPPGGIPALIQDLNKRTTQLTQKRTSATVVQTAEQPDGGIIELRSDGSKRRVHNNGTIVETFKDGSVMKKTSKILLCKLQDGSILQLSDNGDVIDKDVQGSQVQLLEDQSLLIVSHFDGRIVQWDVKTQSGHEERPDGTKIEWDEEGTTVKALPDGTVITSYTDGCVITKTTDGEVEQVNSDGTKIISLPDGRRLQHNPDGSRIEFLADGSRIDSRADGVVIKQGLAAVAKAVSSGLRWEAGVHGRGQEPGQEGGELPESHRVEEELEPQSEVEDDAQIGENDAVVAGSFVVRGARFRDGNALTTVEQKILKEALSVIPYEMGLDVHRKDVSIKATPDGQGGMTVAFELRLDGYECDLEMAEEVYQEMNESLTERGGTVFANSLARTAQELKYTQWLTDKFAVSYLPSGQNLTVPPSWRPVEDQVDPRLEEESSQQSASSTSSGTTPNHTGTRSPSSSTTPQQNLALSPTATNSSVPQESTGSKRSKGTSSSRTSKCRRKVKKGVAKFKTLQGAIKLKGVSALDFDKSLAHTRALKEGLKDVFTHLGLNESTLRIRLTRVRDSLQKGVQPNAQSSCGSVPACVSIDYNVTLKGSARDQAREVVASLKQVFGDSSQRRSFLAKYWSRIPADLQSAPQATHGSGSASSASPPVSHRKKRSKRELGNENTPLSPQSQSHSDSRSSSHVHGASGHVTRKRDKKDRKRSKDSRSKGNASNLLHRLANSVLGAPPTTPSSRESKRGVRNKERKKVLPALR